MNILILDDDPDMLALYQAYFKPPTFNVKCVSQKKEFINALGSAKWEACFIDLNLGENVPDGFQVIKEMRKVYLLKVPIIVVSKFQDREKIAHALECGADDYVTKPLDPDLLKAKLKYLLNDPAFKNNETLDSLQMVKVPAPLAVTTISVPFKIHSVVEEGLVIESENYIAKNNMLTISGDLVKEIWEVDSLKFEVRYTEVIDGKFMMNLEYLDSEEENSQKARQWIIHQPLK